VVLRVEVVVRLPRAAKGLAEDREAIPVPSTTLRMERKARLPIRRVVRLALSMETHSLSLFSVDRVVVGVVPEVFFLEGAAAVARS